MNKVSTLTAALGLTAAYVSLQIFVRSSSLLNLIASCVVALAFYFILEANRAGQRLPAITALASALLFFVLCITSAGRQFDLPDTADVACLEAGLIALFLVVPSWFRGRTATANEAC